MQAYSSNNAHPIFSMRDQVTMALLEALGHIWVLIKMVPQPEESLDMIYMWVEDWDKTWAGIHSWWKYIDDNRITVLKVHDECMHNYTEESVMCQNILVLGAIAIADLWHPVEQRQIHIDDIFKDYQERIELRVQLKVERLTREPSMCKGKGKEKVHPTLQETLSVTVNIQKILQATDKVDELENNEGECPPNPDPLKTGALAPKANLPCREQAKWKCSWLLRVGRKCKNAGSREMAAGPSHKWTKQNSEPTPEHPIPHASPLQPQTCLLLLHLNLLSSFHQQLLHLNLALSQHHHIWTNWETSVTVDSLAD
ncbi:hypothetical protein F5J12DRAFT_785778 [Pisolithus orientalis]|uniref:uncharacterized protein n=1 Tax=Pisolithus orientalis TaxID=936130 RepID=UPI0022241421|nr:uncharacterized protein F5J12DRAFT_785778 [Pisolithus orientalis]KAI5994594.1 hypothetical protein F5J12DRAFT_785778 [Pisolithus orientalis]